MHRVFLFVCLFILFKFSLARISHMTSTNLQKALARHKSGFLFLNTVPPHLGTLSHWVVFILLPGNGSNKNPCSETYRGPSPESEREVSAIVGFITVHGKFKAMVSIHSYSQMVMYPYGHSLEPVPNHEELVR